jgi:hypothetical protein
MTIEALFASLVPLAWFVFIKKSMHCSNMHMFVSAKQKRGSALGSVAS